MDSQLIQHVRNSFPDEMTFQRTWRAYQSRLLDRLESYLENGRLHIVAAPGSGKTIFGLEVIRRINLPTLVLAPTITIRDQWLGRLNEHFLPPGTANLDWVSRDIRRPALLTVTTYQALHALCSGGMQRDEEPLSEEENGTLADQLNGNGDWNGNGHQTGALQLPESLSGFKTLVIDEAHHLRAEWWKTLTYVADQLKPTIVALTATPPYDVSPYEWQRYEDLCGPVDAEIAVPELVLQGDLCPHQDYVYFSTPAKEEQQTLSDFRTAVNTFVQRLRENRDFATAVAIHPWLTNPDAHTEQILEDPEYLSSMVIYLNAVGEDIPSEGLRALGVSRKKIPALELDWLEILLTHCLYSDEESFSRIDALLKSIRHELLHMGAIERRKVVLRNPSDYTKLLTTSKTKLHSIQEIVRLEASAQGNELRCVVLTDFIRKSELPKACSEQAVFEDIGVVPIFETLRRSGAGNIRLGVLSGSLVVVPKDCETLIRDTAAAIGIRPHDLLLRPLAHDSDYCTLELIGEHHQGTVRLLTSVFEQGGITVLIGTKSLLGEGWDAPTINTLILASFVGSYVLSNQMRGRSIRIDPERPNKTANIWHLVCVEPGLFGPGNDYDLLTRRCSAFVGVSATGTTIENGTDRLGLGHPPYTCEQIAEMNACTSRRALDREGLRRSWADALAIGAMKQMTDGLKANEQALPRGFILSNTITALLTQSVFTFLTLFSEFTRRIRPNSDQNYLHYIAVIAAISAVISLPWALLAIWRFIRHGTPERSIRQIGSAVLESLEYEGTLGQRAAEYRVYANRNQDGSVYCWIGGGTGRDQAVYLRALREVLRPVDSPRYLLARKKLWRLFREDYFAVPDVLARKKELAEVFAGNWRRYVGPVQLVYTRTPEGRRLLLRARTHSLASAFQKRSERVSCWK